MNGYELVKKWVEEEKRTNISDYEIDYYGLDGEVALLLLRTKYGARHEVPWDSHYNGNWFFDNPFKKKIPAIELQACRWSQKDFTGWIVSRNNQLENLNVDSFIDTIYLNEKAPKEEIRNKLLTDHAYVGKKYLWRVVETEVYI